MGQPLLVAMLEHFLQNIGLWERSIQECLVKDCIPLKGLHMEQGSRRDELPQNDHSSPLPLFLGSSLINGHHAPAYKSSTWITNSSCNTFPDTPLQTGSTGKAISNRCCYFGKVGGKKR